MVDQKKSEPYQKFPETEQFFLVDQKRGKLTGQLVDQETDQNHMDGTKIKRLCLFIFLHMRKKRFEAVI